MNGPVVLFRLLVDNLDLYFNLKFVFNTALSQNFTIEYLSSRR
jgi:hypothetical protein